MYRTEQNCSKLSQDEMKVYLRVCRLNMQAILDMVLFVPCEPPSPVDDPFERRPVSEKQGTKG